MDKDICSACGKENTYNTYIEIEDKYFYDKKVRFCKCECGHILMKEENKAEINFPLLTEIKIRINLGETKEEIYKGLTNEQKKQYKEELERLYDIVNNIIIPGWQGFVKSMENMKNIIRDNWPWDVWPKE